MEWIKVEDDKSNEGQLVWAGNPDKGWVDLYSLQHLNNEGWFWCKSNGTFWMEDGEIKGETEEMDDYDITHWYPATP